MTAVDRYDGMLGVAHEKCDADFRQATLPDLPVDGGVLVFDNSPLPPDGNQPALAVGTSEDGEYARIVQQVPTGDGCLDWRALTFAPDGSWFLNRREMTPFSDATVAAALSRCGFAVHIHEGYGPDDGRTVFVAVA